MHEKPKLRSSIRLDVVAPDLAVARSEDHVSVFEGRLVPLLAPWLDGRRSVTEIVEALGGEANAVDVRFGLSLLAKKNLLVEGEAAAPGKRFVLEGLGLDPGPARRRLRKKAVEVAALGDLDPQPLISALRSLGVRVAAGGEHRVVLTESYLRPELDRVNRRQLAAGKPWLLVKPAGLVPWIGPLLRPPETGCWACLARRLEENDPYPELLVEALGGAAASFAAPAPVLPWILHLVANAAALQVLRWIAGGRSPDLEGRLVTFDARTLAGEGHQLVRRGDCPCCGPSPPARPDPVELRSVRRSDSRDGGYRAAPPEETWRRLAHLISPITGVVGRVRDRSLGAARVCLADHPGPGSDPREDLQTGRRRLAAGKGTGAEQARVSALCEALERYSGIYRGDEPRRRARFADLGEDAVHPNACMTYSAAQYRERERWAALAPACWVPVPFDEEKEVDWSPLWSLTESRFRYLPTACCYYGYPLAEEERFARADSNGNAAGTCLEEAILQGFLELVERDAVAVWWYNRLPRPGVDLAGFCLPYCDEMTALYRSLGREVHVLDLTHDLEVPVFAAVSWRTEERSELLLGFGAHFAAEIALARALSEMSQFLPGLAAGRERRIASGPVRALTHLLPAGQARGRQSCRRGAGRDLREDVLYAVDLARRHGLETLVLDQTRAELGVRVVKVVVPGLRSHWPRWGPGRLYDVPVAAGWLAQPRREDELCPVHLLL